MQLVSDAESTPSARLLAELREGNKSFFEFALECSTGHKQYFADLAALSTERHEDFAGEVAESLRRQQDIEKTDSIKLEEYLERWFSTD